MPIDYSKLRSLTLRQLVRALIKDGFQLIRHKDATRLFRHPDGRRVVIHFHKPSQTLKLSTPREIIELVLQIQLQFSTRSQHCVIPAKANSPAIDAALFCCYNPNAFS